MPYRFVRFAIALALSSAIAFLALRPERDTSAGPAEAKRVAWTTSKITGSPEPPHPYRLVSAFPKLKFVNPLHMEHMPGSDRFFVLEHAGKIFSFPNRPDVSKADLAIDFAKDLTSWKPGGEIEKLDAVYGLTFHPKFAENRYCYISYVLKGVGKTELAEGSRVSRFTVTNTDPPRIDPASEKLVLTFLAGGHNGACLAFGHDGCLYISTGDARSPNPPDPLNTGQDCSDLLSSILRVDIDHAEKGQGYAIPKDNPFVGLAGVRPEIWSFGFRNPWKMSFDRKTGDLWVGDVGWELYEMVYRIQKGGNYGWSVKEGPQWIKPESKLGPTPILPPQIAFPHTEAASITGGFVYRGNKFKDLVGAYVCGDWMSRKYWAARFDGDKLTTLTELAQGMPKVVSFAQDAAGELFIVDYNETGGIYAFEPNPDANKPRPPFPTRISETGLFADTAKVVPAPGVYPYEIVAEPWLDHATAERHVGLPASTAATFYQSLQKVPDTEWFNSRVFFPKDGVLARTISIELERGNAASRKRLETQIMHFNGREFFGYTYKWNEAGTDATLVPGAGEDMELTVKDDQAPGGVRKQTWHFPSRTECRQCHNPWAGEVLGFTESQLRMGGNKSGGVDGFARLVDLGLIVRGKEPKPGDDRPGTLVNPHDASASIDARGRSYLHANCAHCHQFGAGGSVRLVLPIETTLDGTQAINALPMQGTFGIPDCKIIAPGDPARSVLYYRMAKQGRGRMPHIGSELVDEAGVKLIRDWIRQIPPRTAETALLETCCRTDAKPNERQDALAKLLATPAGALLVQEAWDAHRLPESAKADVLAAAIKTEAPIRDLFERYVPDAQKTKRLGTIIRPEGLLAVKGDISRGKDVFFNKTTGLQCATCHKVAGQGGEIGPDLSQIGKKLTKRQILESILDPSKDIDAKYAAYSIETDDGRKLTGLIVARDDMSLTIRDAQGKDAKIPLTQVASQVPSKKSLMPDQLLRDVTAEQAADLLAYLERLK